MSIEIYPDHFSAVFFAIVKLHLVIFTINACNLILIFGHFWMICLSIHPTPKACSRIIYKFDIKTLMLLLSCNMIGFICEFHCKIGICYRL